MPHQNASSSEWQLILYYLANELIQHVEFSTWIYNDTSAGEGDSKWRLIRNGRRNGGKVAWIRFFPHFFFSVLILVEDSFPPKNQQFEAGTALE